MTARTTRHFRELGRTRRFRLGSRRRLQRIRFRGNWSLEAILFFVAMLFILTIVVPWLIRHPPDDPEEPDGEPAFRAVGVTR